MLFPYLGGADLNGNPGQVASRWIVNFFDWPIEKAMEYAEPFKWISGDLYRHRMSLSNKPNLRRLWWQYERRAVALYSAIQDLDAVLAIGLVSRTIAFVPVEARQVFSHKVGVVASKSPGFDAVLNSSIHVAWAICYGSRMGQGLNYSPSDVFETFPLPDFTSELVDAGVELAKARSAASTRLGLALTDLYAAVNEPADVPPQEIVRMRSAIARVDFALMAAYGWRDVSLDHGIHTYRELKRWTVSPAARVEVLDRLLELNHERAMAEGQDITEQRRSAE